MNRRPSPRATLFVDADNTLWDTDSVFANTQLRLLDDIEHALGSKCVAEDRLGFVRAADQKLASLHHDGLRYPPALLVRALAMALGGLNPVRAAKVAWQKGEASDFDPNSENRILANYFKSLQVMPELRGGVAEGLKQMRELDWNILVLTESAVKRATVTTEALGISKFINRIIEGRKRPELYLRILKLVGPVPKAFMVGDQLDRDIGPAKAAGLKTIYFPGGFVPRWHPREDVVLPDFKIDRFDQIIDIVETF